MLGVALQSDLFICNPLDLTSMVNGLPKTSHRQQALLLKLARATVWLRHCVKLGKTLNEMLYCICLFIKTG